MASETTIVDQLAKLAELRQGGHITHPEYEAAKAKLLASEKPTATITNNSSAPMPSGATQPEKKGGCVSQVAFSLGGVILLIVLLSIVGSLKNGPSPADQLYADQQASRAAAIPEWPTPEGFERYLDKHGDPIAYRYLKPKEYSCDFSGYCWGVEFISSKDCPSGFYAAIKITDKADNNIGWTNDSAQGVDRNEKVRLIFHTYEKGARGAQLTEVNCY